MVPIPQLLESTSLVLSLLMVPHDDRFIAHGSTRRWGLDSLLREFSALLCSLMRLPAHEAGNSVDSD
eukprot:1942022-Amphidinium_carterae.1